MTDYEKAIKAENIYRLVNLSLEASGDEELAKDFRDITDEFISPIIREYMNR